MPDLFPIDAEACKHRHHRLIAQLERDNLELAVLNCPESVQWLTGCFAPPPFVTAAVVSTTGSVILVLPQHLAETTFAADKKVAYQSQIEATLREDLRRVCHDSLFQSLPKLPTRTGGELSWLGWNFASSCDTEWIDIEATLLQLRRKKEADELRQMQYANRANRAMFETARKIIRPGITELEVHSHLYGAAAHSLGEPLTYFGHDFQCNSIGGPPRARKAQSGELYILDLGVGFRGYRSDNARTFAVDGELSKLQTKAWKHLEDIFAFVESSVRPGVSCRQLYTQAKQMLDECSPWKFEHHLGHGVGLSPHETPRLNPHWDDYFEEGDFFTVEPGLYHEELRHGVRLEQNYLVTSNGVELLTDWSLSHELQ